MSLQPFRTNVKQLIGALTTYFYRRGGGVHGLYAFHPITEPLTNTAFDGDSFSTVATHTKIENTSWSIAIPSGAVALSVRASVRDSASLANVCGFALFSTSTATHTPLYAYPSGKANDAWAENNGIVPCTSGDIWYECTASGTDTLDVWLLVTGYWL